MSSKMSFTHNSSNASESSSNASSAGDGPAHIMNGMSKSPAPNDNWVGQKFIEYYLAQFIVDSASTQDSNSTLDSRLESVLQAFNYAKCWVYLRSKGVDKRSTLSNGGDSHRETLLSWIGLVVSEGSTTERSLMRHAVRKFMTPVPSGSESSPQQQHEIAVYTSLLNEYGQTEQHEPEYAWTTYSREPLIFECVVRFKRVKASGRGRTKMQAKHQASFEACQRLGLFPD